MSASSVEDAADELHYKIRTMLNKLDGLVYDIVDSGYIHASFTHSSAPGSVVKIIDFDRALKGDSIYNICKKRGECDTFARDYVAALEELNLFCEEQKDFKAQLRYIDHTLRDIDANDKMFVVAHSGRYAGQTPEEMFAEMTREHVEPLKALYAAVKSGARTFTKQDNAYVRDQLTYISSYGYALSRIDGG